MTVTLTGLTKLSLALGGTPWNILKSYATIIVNKLNKLFRRKKARENIAKEGELFTT